LSRETNIVEEIKNRVDTVEAIGRLVQLKHAGKSWSGLCPFHKDTNPSFTVYEDSGNYQCWACGAKGDIITFYEKYYGLDFLGACERLAKENGIDWQPGGAFSADKSRIDLYEANRFAGGVYYEAIKKEGNQALEYLLGRGLDRKTISKFRLGYADSGGRALAKRLEGDEIMRKAAEEVGLIYKDKFNGQYRDRFEGRVMFPIVNTRGKVIGFGGRDIDGKSKAKYINSAASNVYTKGSALYGLNVTQEHIREQGFAVIVEGYMDLIALYMHGVTNVCAPLGTAFTLQQAKLLGKYTKKAMLAFDSDGPGQKAALSSMDVLSEAGLKVEVLALTGAKDPDEFIRAFGKERFDAAVRDAVPMNDFKLDRIKEEYDITASGGLPDFVKAAARLIATFSPVDRDYYKQKLSRETGISEEAIAMQMGESRKDSRAERPSREQEAGTVSATDDLLAGILGMALNSDRALEKSEEYRHMFCRTDYGGIMDALLALKGSAGVAPTAAELSEALDEADQAVLDMILKRSAKNADDGDDNRIDEYLAKLEMAGLRANEAELKEKAGTDALLLKELIEIQRRIKLLENNIRSGRRGEQS